MTHKKDISILLIEAILEKERFGQLCPQTIKELNERL